MKKYNLIVVIIASVVGLILLLSLFLNQKEKINVYLFWGNGCPHCENAKEFLINNDYNKYYNLVEYEVWYDETNQELMEKVAAELNIEVRGVPFIVIGNKYSSGYSNSMNAEINNIIISEYENEDYIDLIEKVK